MNKSKRNRKNPIAIVAVMMAVLFVIGFIESKVDGFARVLTMLMFIVAAVSIMHREYKGKKSKKKNTAKSSVQPPEGNHNMPIYEDSSIKSGTKGKKEPDLDKSAAGVAILLLSVMAVFIIGMLVLVITFFFDPETNNLIPTAILLIFAGQVALIVCAVKRENKKKSVAAGVEVEKDSLADKGEKLEESAVNSSDAAPTIPAESAVYNEQTMEESLAQDRQKRLEQLDIFLKNGIIDKKEYRKLYSKYKKG